MTCTLRSYDSTRPPSPLLPLRPFFFSLIAFFFISPSPPVVAAQRASWCVWCVCRLASTLVPLIFKFEVLQYFVKKKNGLYLQLVTVPPCPPQ
jgi:hypothetical protein